MLGLKLNHVSKRGHRGYQDITCSKANDANGRFKIKIEKCFSNKIHIKIGETRTFLETYVNAMTADTLATRGVMI